MTISDPIDQLSALADMREDPPTAYRERLLHDLLEQLNAADDKVTNHIAVVDLREQGTKPFRSAPSRRAMAVAAVALVVAGVGLWLGNVRQDQTSMTEAAEEDAAPATGDGISYETASALISAAGGIQALVVGEVEERSPWNMVTFDPLDNDRVLFADVEYRFPTTAELWTIGDGVSRTETLPWLEAVKPKSGGIYQRDGTIVFNKDASQSTGWPILTNDGNLLARPITQNQLGLVVSEAERPLIVSGSQSECPTQSVQVGGADQATLLNREPNGFARVAIPETGVAMAFPYHLNRDACDETTSKVARAWNLVTGDPLPDYPLDGMAIAFAAVSGDGTRAIVLSPGGQVSIISMSSGRPLRELTTARVGELYNPLALNTDGTIAAVATSAGQVSVWHVNSGQLLFEIDGEERSVWSGMYFDVGPGLAYDATRAAVLDAAAGKWTVYTLEPTDWVDKACANGLTLDQFRDELEILGLNATC